MSPLRPVNVELLHNQLQCMRSQQESASDQDAEGRNDSYVFLVTHESIQSSCVHPSAQVTAPLTGFDTLAIFFWGSRSVGKMHPMIDRSHANYLHANYLLLVKGLQL